MTTRQKAVQAIRDKHPYILLEATDIRLNKNNKTWDVWSWEATCKRAGWRDGQVKEFQIGSWAGLREIARGEWFTLNEEYLFLEIASGS